MRLPFPGSKREEAYLWYLTYSKYYDSMQPMKDLLTSYGIYLVGGAIVGWGFLMIILVFQGIAKLQDWLADRKIARESKTSL